MRGKGDNPLRQGALSRITPAYAGKRDKYDDEETQKVNHPRLCGEKRLVKVSQTATCGITPAYAGKSRSTRPVRRRGQDHPRLCGEKKNERL